MVSWINPDQRQAFYSVYRDGIQVATSLRQVTLFPASHVHESIPVKRSRSDATGPFPLFFLNVGWCSAMAEKSFRHRAVTWRLTAFAGKLDRHVFRSKHED